MYTKTPTLIWTVGNVGSSALAHILHKEGYDPFNLHYLYPENLDGLKSLNRQGGKELPSKLLNLTKQVQDNLPLWRESGLKIITSIREPISRAIPPHFLNIEGERDGASTKGKREELLKFETISPYRSPLNWFDIEFKKVLGLDVYAKNFNSDKKYTTFKIDNIDILLFRVDIPHLQKEKMLSEFLGQKIKIANQDSGPGPVPDYEDTYKYVRDNIDIPPDVLNEIYSSKLCQHFWSQDELLKLQKFWTKRPPAKKTSPKTQKSPEKSTAKIVKQGSRDPNFPNKKIEAILKQHQDGMSAREVCRQHDVPLVTFYKWKANSELSEIPDSVRNRAREIRRVHRSAYYFGHHKCATNWMRPFLSHLSRKANWNYFVYKGMAGERRELVGAHGTVHLHVNANYRDTIAMRPEDRGFHLFRDPRDALISGYWSWRNSHKNNQDTLLEMREKLQTASLEDGLILMLDHLIMSVQMEGWKVNGYDNILEVRYEDLVANPTKKFREITSFLKVDVTDEEIADTMDLTSFERMSKGRKPGEEDTKSHFRKGVPGDWENVFTDKVKDAFKERYGEHLIELGYEDGTSW